MYVWRHCSARTGFAACAAGASYCQQQRQRGCRAEDLPERTFSRREVAEHDSEARGVWLTYKDGVYDVSRFLHKHPGGITRIMQGAGGDVKGFFDHWAVHKQHLAQSVLATYRIGRLRDEDLQDDAAEEDPFAEEPERSHGLRGLVTTYDDKPYIGETRVMPFTFETPNDLFYVRNHAPVPQLIEPVSAHTVDVYLEEEHLAEWTLADLASDLGTVEFHATVQCSGNRLGEMFSHLAPGTAAQAAWRGKTDVSGYQIGNALWSGVPLARLLRSVDSAGGGLAKGSGTLSAASFVEFHGEDDYFISMPLEFVLADEHEGLLATHMNGERLPRDHGAPVRLLLPGLVGCRSVKWLNKIVLRGDAGDSPWVQHFYKHDGKPILQWPVQSMITVVQGIAAPDLAVGLPPSHTLEGNVGQEGLRVAGFAYVGGGRRLDKVEVSADDGASWLEARVRDQVIRPSGKQWAWSLWELQVPLPEGKVDGDTVTLSCRAMDSDGRTQPVTPALALKATPSGYLFNAIHKVSLTVHLHGNPQYIAA